MVARQQHASRKVNSQVGGDQRRDHLIARKGEQLPISDTNGCRGRGSRILEGTSAAAWGGSGHIR